MKTKIALTILILIQIVSNSIGQNFGIRLFVTDSLGRKDTIEFGLNESATLDVDVAYGEQNIYGEAFDSLDIRIIHRDSVHHHCLQEDPFWNVPLYFDTNRDFKIDYRPFSGSFESVNMNFEILIKAINPPLAITTDFSDLQWNMYEGWSTLNLLNSNCASVALEPIVFIGLNDTIFTTNDTLTTLIAHFEHEVGVKENNYRHIYLCPNPTSSKIEVVAEIPLILKLSDLFGREFQVSKSNTMNLSNLSNGIYVLRIFDKNENLIRIEKIIKR